MTADVIDFPFNRGCVHYLWQRGDRVTLPDGRTGHIDAFPGDRLATVSILSAPDGRVTVSLSALVLA